MTGTVHEHRVDIPKRQLARGAPLRENEPVILPDLFHQAVIKNNLPDALNYKDVDGWKAISSSEMISRIESIASGLYSVGLRKGDKAAILAPNSPEWTLTDAACQFAGII